VTRGGQFRAPGEIAESGARVVGAVSTTSNSPVSIPNRFRSARMASAFELRAGRDLARLRRRTRYQHAALQQRPPSSRFFATARFASKELTPASAARMNCRDLSTV